jgi:hypothetical protein
LSMAATRSGMPAPVAAESSSTGTFQLSSVSARLRAPLRSARAIHMGDMSPFASYGMLARRIRVIAS